MASTPFAMRGNMISAADGSAHHHPRAALRIRPTKRMQSVCFPSSFPALVQARCPSSFFARDKTGHHKKRNTGQDNFCNAVLWTLFLPRSETLIRDVDRESAKADQHSVDRYLCEAVNSETHQRVCLQRLPQPSLPAPPNCSTPS